MSGAKPIYSDLLVVEDTVSYSSRNGEEILWILMYVYRLYKPVEQLLPEILRPEHVFAMPSRIGGGDSVDAELTIVSHIGFDETSDMETYFSDDIDEKTLAPRGREYEPIWAYMFSAIYVSRSILFNEVCGQVEARVNYIKTPWFTVEYRPDLTLGEAEEDKECVEKIENPVYTVQIHGIGTNMMIKGILLPTLRFLEENYPYIERSGGKNKPVIHEET